ncbi:MAG: glycosyl transferase family 2, partial [Chloroflexi bacterium]
MAAAAPLVSVCVPTYNDAPFLAQSLQSIVQQTYRQLEILIGDDASTDDTAAVVAAFDDPRIRYIRNTANLGQFENVNALIRRATGDYIAIYHSDDVYTPQIVAREAAFLQSHPQVGAVFALDWRIDERGA